MEASNEFYIYLSSNESKTQYPENKACTFTNKLARPLILDGEYSVAVQNVIFNPVFYRLEMFDKDYYIHFNIKYYDIDQISRNGTNFVYYPTVNMQADM